MDVVPRSASPHAWPIYPLEPVLEGEARWTDFTFRLGLIARLAGRPIEIVFIDIAKHWTTCDWVTAQFFPSLIAGRSIIVQQDYLYHHWVAWLHVTMEYYADYFEIVCDTELNSVAFLNTRRIPAEVLRDKTVESLSIAEKAELMERAARRFEGEKAKTLRAAKDHFLEMLQNDRHSV